MRKIISVAKKTELNILFVSDVSIESVIGGAERVLYEQSTRIARERHEVQILTRAFPGNNKNREVIHGVKEWRYEIESKNSAAYLCSTWNNSKKLFESLHAENPFDHIIFHQPFSSLGVICSSKSKKVRKTYICHSLSFEEYVSRNEMPKSIFVISYLLNVTMRRWIERKVLYKSDAIVVLSQFTKDKLIKAYNIPSEKISIIPGGVDIERFQPAARKVEIRKKFDVPADRVLLFTVRNLVQRMGLKNLIEALPEVIKSAPDVLMLIGGEGPLREALKAKSEELGVKNYIRFEGFIPEESLPDYYRMADIFILPTKELEGFGLVTLEAMASGVPVLGTPVGGTREILGKFCPGFLFKDTTPASISELIIEKYRTIKDSPEKWNDISASCRRFVEENYSWEKHVCALERLLTEAF